MQTVGEYEYRPGDLIGHGAFALVFGGRHKKTGAPVAVKQILLKTIVGKLSNIRQKEISILKGLQHPNIVQLYHYQETSAEIYLILEFCNGGDLAEYLQEKKTLSEESIRHLTRQLAGALHAIHERDIIHRDIKPQNILLSFPCIQTSSPQQRKQNIMQQPFLEASLKLGDFGFARHLGGTDMAATLCGSPLYMAPEILTGRRYDSKADLWSTGTILFQCLSGIAPFQAPNPHALRRKYEREKLIPRIPEGTSPLLADLLLKLIKKNPVDRLGHNELVAHAFLLDPELSLKQAHLLSIDPYAQQHTRSSPVPIRRQHSTTASGYTSSTSPHTSPSTNSHQTPRSSVGSAQRYISPSSGPPTIHRIGSSSSLADLATSNSSDVTDQGFVLVGPPGNPSLHSQHHYSTSSSSPLSIHLGSVGSYGGSVGHTPSSNGSYPRYSSLVTPFYQPSAPSPTPRTAPTTSHVPKTAPSSAKVADGNNAQSAKLAKTPPFESLRKMWGVSTQAEVSSLDSTDGPSHRTSPRYSPSSSSPMPVPLARGRSGSRDPSSPVQQPTADRSPLSARRSLPGSRGSQNTLATLLESRHEDTTDSAGGGKGYEEFVTHSMLLQSEVLPNEPSSTSPQWRTGQTGLQGDEMSLVPLGQWSADRSAGSRGNELRLPSALELSQQLAELQQHSSTFNKKRGLLFHIGDTEDEDRVMRSGDLSPTQALVPSRIAAMKLDLSVIESNNGSSGRSTRRRLSSSSMDDEMFSLEEEQPDLCLMSLQTSIAVAQELLRLAKGRQGPLLLLSSSYSLGDSGSVDHAQRFSEQLILCTKAATVLRLGCRQYHIQVASSSSTLDATDSHRNALQEAEKLQAHCLEKARLARELYTKCVSKRRTPSHVRVTAERLLFLHAVDLSKNALLEEASQKKAECVKKYRLSRLLLCQLVSDSTTDHDRSVLNKYISAVDHKLRILQVSCS